jgi:hypothetical protein
MAEILPENSDLTGVLGPPEMAATNAYQVF